MPIELVPISSSNYPVTVAEVRTHLRLSDSVDGTYLTGLIAAATDFAEGEMEATLVARNRTAVFYDGQTEAVLPRGPLVSITSVTDADGKVLAAGTSGYSVRKVGHSDRLVIHSGYRPPLTVVYRAGHESPDTIPASIRHAIKMHVGTLYEARESTTDKPRGNVPHGLEAFYRNHRRTVGVG